MDGRGLVRGETAGTGERPGLVLGSGPPGPAASGLGLRATLHRDGRVQRSGRQHGFQGLQVARSRGTGSNARYRMRQTSAARRSGLGTGRQRRAHGLAPLSPDGRFLAGMAPEGPSASGTWIDRKPPARRPARHGRVGGHGHQCRRPSRGPARPETRTPSGSRPAPGPAVPILLGAPGRRGSSARVYDRDGSWLAAACDDGVLRVWDLRIEGLVDAATTAGRNLIVGEWQRYFPGLPYRPTFLDVPQQRFYRDDPVEVARNLTLAESVRHFPGRPYQPTFPIGRCRPTTRRLTRWPGTWPRPGGQGSIRASPTSRPFRAGPFPQDDQRSAPPAAGQVERSRARTIS